MASTSETGHAKNVGNFDTLISFCLGYEGDYNPSKEVLKVANLVTRLNDARTALKKVGQTKTAYTNTANARAATYKPLKVLGTRIIHALEATDASAATIKNAKSINRKIQGKRAGHKPDEPENPPVKEGEDDPGKSILVSQLSYDQQLAHFTLLVELLKAEPSYMPNEADLTVAALEAMLAQMETDNTNVKNATTNWSNACIERNEQLYNGETNLLKVADDVKSYVLSVYKASSPKYKQVSGIQFKKV